MFLALLLCVFYLSMSLLVFICCLFICFFVLFADLFVYSFMYLFICLLIFVHNHLFICSFLNLLSSHTFSFLADSLRSVHCHCGTFFRKHINYMCLCVFVCVFLCLALSIFVSFLSPGPSLSIYFSISRHLRLACSAPSHSVSLSLSFSLLDSLQGQLLSCRVTRLATMLSWHC